MKFNLFSLKITALALAAGALTTPAQAAAPVGLFNGTFAINGGSGQLTVNTTLSDWAGTGKEGGFGSQTTPPVFVFALGTTAQLSSTGVAGDGFMGTVKFYGATASPAGGVVVAAMGDPSWAGGLSESIAGLTPGTTYALSFNWAGAQQQGFSGATTEQWQVALGSSTQTTSLVNTPSQTFANWQTATMDFTATSANQTLTFTALGQPSGETPWLLLNNVTMSALAVPEPGSLALLALGAVGGVAAWRRRRP